MKYVPPIGGAANDPYVDVNPGAGIAGSLVSGAAIERPQREIVQVITDAALVPADGDLTQLSAAIKALIPANSPLPRGHIGGLTLSNDGVTPLTVLDVAAGACRSDDNTTNIVQAAGVTKTLGAWAVGSGNGSLDMGAVAANTIYHVFKIKRTDTGVDDVLTSLSATAPTMPANYTKKRRIGAIRTAAASTNILAFTQVGDEFLLAASITDVNVTTLGTVASLYALSVPTGIKVGAIFDCYFYANGVGAGMISSPDSPDDAVGNGTPPWGNTVSFASGVAMYSRFNGLRTDTSGRIRARSQAASSSLGIQTLGWVDNRGRHD